MSATANNARFCCLALETATQRGSVAACIDDAVFTVHLDDSSGSSRRIYQAIQEALNRASLQRGDLQCIAFGNGPGSFTGVRVATSVAQALAYALDVPVIPVSTLAAVAVEAGRSRGMEPVAVCLDARMGEVYTGVYRFAADGTAEAILTDRLADPATFSLEDYSGAFAAGPGWEAYPDLLAANAGYIAGQATDIWPGAAAVAVEARELFRQGRTVVAHDALPNYIRNNVTY
ncbi:MAG: tRNA (adenosine(37)-N6)-threonylcarbamoyltransferase complex dimerization subunit type 1 TsaB [Gammaproteobacteria bacterium]|nr:tRNA (adenosine(37)-N6)-threonylcarbamoyltransferase complex dimerization subunit type 1 TsaB [Gammaproteobacteria bacterium]